MKGKVIASYQELRVWSLHLDLTTGGVYTFNTDPESSKYLLFDIGFEDKFSVPVEFVELIP